MTTNCRIKYDELFNQMWRRGKRLKDNILVLKAIAKSYSPVEEVIIPFP